MIRRSKLLVLGLAVVVVFCLFTAELSADPLDNWHSRNPLPQGNDLYGVAYGNGVYVAVGDSGTVIASSDGLIWESKMITKGARLCGVAYGNGVFVLVGWDGMILISADGRSWSGVKSGGGNLIAVTFGNGLFVAIEESGKSWRSADGMKWQGGGVGKTSWLSDVSFGGGLFVCVGYHEARGSGKLYGTIFTSTDGLRWESRVAGTNNPLYGVAFGKGLFVTVGFLGEMLISHDGASWTKQDSGVSNNLYGITFANGTFIVVGGGVILDSKDALTWGSRGVYYYTVLRRVAHGDGLFVAVGTYGEIYTSQEGSEWADVTFNQIYGPQGFVYGNGTYVSWAGSTGWGVTCLYVSRDGGATWTDQSPNRCLNIYGMAYGNGRFLQAQGDGVLASVDAMEWTKTDSHSFVAMAYGKGLFVAVGTDGNIFTSHDGEAWTQRTSWTTSSIWKIAYGDGMFTAWGWRSPTIFGSPDGISWTELFPTAPHRFEYVLFGKGIFVAVADYGCVLVSNDGLLWTRELVGSGLLAQRMAYGNGNFVTAAYDSSLAGSYILSSEDGIDWTQRLWVPSQLSGNDYAGGTFFVWGGFGGTPYDLLLQSDHVAGPRIAVAPASIDFGRVPVESNHQATLNIRNGGTEDLKIGTVGTPSPPINVLSDVCTGVILAPGAGCSITFGFSFLSIGMFSQSLNIPSNDPDRPNVALNLTGTSVAPDLKGEWGNVTYACASKCKVKGTLNLQNMGNLAASSASVRFYLSDNGTVYTEDGFLKQILTGTIKAGGGKVKNLSYSFPSGKSASNKYIIAVIDADNSVTEADESNNKVVYGPVE